LAVSPAASRPSGSGRATLVAGIDGVEASLAGDSIAIGRVDGGSLEAISHVPGQPA
jgi:hypothetical protein